MPKTPRIPPIRPIDILAFDGVQLLDLAGPLQVFASANDLSGAVPPYAPRIVSASGGNVVTSAGLPLATQVFGPPDVPLDTLLVPGGRGVDAAAKDPALLRWILTRATLARRTASVCTGAFLLAQAGLLDGRRVVTHWHFCAQLAQRFPELRVEPDPIFIEDGPIWTSAGITAGIDLALALVERDCGRPLALAVARHLVVFLKRPGGQSQFSAALSLQSVDQNFDALNAWITEHLDEPLGIGRLAAQAGMSDRSFARHYRAKVGVTPAEAVERLRVDAARRLLGDEAMAVKRVARRCGFGSEETMRRAFLRRLGTSPNAYRARFAGQAEAVPRRQTAGSRMVSPQTSP